MRRIVLCLILFSSFCSGYAQTPPVYTSADILLQLKKLNTLGSVLYVAAHPDDENTRLLAYLSREKAYRTGYLSMTRGDGGQNLIGGEQGIELGLIRTQELMAARRVDGAEQFFSRAYDFGFSKTTEEALRIWDHDKILSDVVWVIRKFQPDVIITRFPGDARAGHGHHSASAVLAQEAFKKAADPNAFPEQFKYGVKPWQAKRIFWNTFNFGSVNTTANDQLQIDVGVYNPILGKSYGEIAAESRSLHKSQGFGVPRSRGQIIEYFSLLDGSPAGNELLEGINTAWSRAGDNGTIQNHIEQVIHEFSISNPERSVPALARIYKEISALPTGYWRDQKLKETQQLLEETSALWLEAYVNSPHAAKGDSIRMNIGIVNRLLPSLIIKNISTEGFDTTLNYSLANNKLLNFSRMLPISPSKKITQPYWLENDMNPGSFEVKDQLQIGDAQSAPAYQVKFEVEIEGQSFIFNKPVQYKYTDPVRGEVYEPFTIVPRITAHLEPELIVLNTPASKHFIVETKKQSPKALNVQPVITNMVNVQVKEEGNAHNGTFVFDAVRNNSSTSVNNAQLLFRENGMEEPAKELKTIAYEHIPRIDYFISPKLKLIVADVQTVGRKIGYIEGAGDKVPEALLQMGYEVVMLKERDLTSSNLKQFDAVITGVRTYNTRNFMAERYEELMNYIKDGGNLIVQYNTANIPSQLMNKIGPYPFSIVNKRVTDENASVIFLRPDHPVLNYPNKISATDFDNWIQERGIYFADNVDNRYETVLSMKDPQESEQTTSLIIGNYGKGKFVYTGLVFFRELPAGVPGAYRLLANIIALNHKKGF